MTTTKLIPASYKQLVSDIISFYISARRALVEAYWKIGQRIVEVEQKGEIRAAYGDTLLQKVSDDLSKELGRDFSHSHLRRIRQFYLANSKCAPAHKLTWAQHIELLPIQDERTRSHLEKKAERENLKRDDLRKLVRNERVREKVALNLARAKDGTPYTLPNRKLLEPFRGTLATYRILDPQTVQPKEPGLLLVDLGFSCYRDLDAITSKTLKPGAIVQSVKTGDGRYTLKPFPEPDPLYTYKATVEKIVDGDTLRVVVDLGFDTRTRQYLRLRGIDCPEKDTEEGKRAADFVRSRIKASGEILLTSSRSDKYDRYLADVFFTDPNGEEHYLNNLLLKSGLAVRAKT